MKCLIHCTKRKPYLMVGKNKNKTFLENGGKDSVFSPDHNYIGNGKIVAEFECDKVEEIKEIIEQENEFGGYYPILGGEELLKNSCLTEEELKNYLKYSTKKNVYGYAIHISNLKMFDRPLELKEVEVSNENANPYLDSPLKPLTKAPQNMCYCYYKGEMYVLISIRPEWVAKILNRKKMIEVRKQIVKVLKEMI